MKSDFNEFTYAYAVTEDAIRHLTASLTCAPFIPSLYDEGKPGGGFDIKLSTPGYALFYQYKISDYIGKRGKLWKDFDHDYYRFKIWKSNKSDQQRLMMDLENTGEQIYYVAPIFSTNKELNDSYTGHTVASKSIFVKPSDIGDLPDTKEHYWAFDGLGMQFFCSEPIKKENPTDIASWLKQLPVLDENSSLEVNLSSSLRNLQVTASKIEGSSVLNRLISNQPLAMQVETLARSLGCGTVLLSRPSEQLETEDDESELSTLR